MKKFVKWAAVIIGFPILMFFISWGMLLVTTKPSNDRDWSNDLAVLPYADFNGNLVTIHNVRNFKYKDVLDFTPGYYDKTFDLNTIKSVDFIVEPFSTLAAHTFLAFGFEDGSYIDISVEIRREKGEFFDGLKGLFRNYEITYVVSDEHDVLKLRTNYRKDDVYLYPIPTSEEKVRALFVDMLTRVNKLRTTPEFYNSLTNNCTTNIVKHVNTINPKRIPWSYKYVFPSYSDELALEIGLIKGEGTIDQIRAQYLITPLAQKYGDSSDFSAKIRGK
ncbi:MAG TPA: DUF4105 domain-containing protein [Candidatus Nanoarchaeia archaeon]|nr:DUF4105 domain-containing protein [Candidatus Nanoarchaeia archaeon]